MQKELKRIARKARRFTTRNKFSKPAHYRVDQENHPGVSLYSGESSNIPKKEIIMKTLQTALSSKNAKLVIAAPLLLVASTSAFSMDAAVTTAVTGLAADTASVALSILLAVVGIFALKFVRKAL
jgi:hypothetical protein